MLDEPNKQHLKLLYDEFLKINKSIRASIENADLASADSSVQNKDVLIKRILAFEKPYIEDIKNSPELFQQRKYLINLESENLELLISLRNEVEKKFASINKTKRVYNAYEPGLNNIQSTIDIQDSE